MIRGFAAAKRYRIPDSLQGSCMNISIDRNGNGNDGGSGDEARPVRLYCRNEACKAARNEQQHIIQEEADIDSGYPLETTDCGRQRSQGKRNPRRQDQDNGNQNGNDRMSRFVRSRD